jgi:hypothetical protein
MNRHFIIALAALAASFVAHAAEPPATPVKPTPAVSAPAKAAPATPAAAPQKTAATSQQDRMRECNKQATGKKGPERKEFMKTCLSSSKKS